MQQIIISEGFYSSPDQMSSLFSTVDYTKNENFLKGLICPLNYANEDMLRQMEFIVNVPENSFEFVEGSGAFIINQENDLPSHSVSVNFPDINTHWIGIVCLSHSEEPHFLKFYRNKRTGWAGLPKDINEFQKYNVNSFSDFDKFIEEENEDWESKWTESTRIEFEYNKLIMFRPGLFHSYNDVYGDSQQTGRLLQFFFLRPKTLPQE